jgi:alpha-beta hydrolase superfamily lysophospholipase
MIKKKSDFVKSFDGKNLHLLQWKHTDEPPKAVLHIVHGMAEYADRYDDFARFMTENGFVVYANDHRGHGFTQTDGKLGFFDANDGWTLVVKDIKTISDYIKEQHPDIPYIILGHSMGSFISRTFVIKYPNVANALILSGTAYHPGKIAKVGKTIASIQKILFKAHSPSYLLNYLTFGSYTKKYKNVKTKFDFLSRDPEIVRKYIHDDLCGFICPNSFFIDLLNGLDFIHDENNIRKMNLDTPILLAAGKDDPVGEYGKGVEKVFEMFKKININNLDIILYPEARHEIINELNKMEVYNDLLKWITHKFPKCFNQN